MTPTETKMKKDPDSGSGSGNSGPGPGSDPFGFGMGGANFDMGDLGQIFTKLGEMFSGAGSAMGGGKQSGPVNYDLARQLASNSIGFVAPVPEKTVGAVADAVRLAEDVARRGHPAARGHHLVGGVDSQRLAGQHPGHLEAAVRPGGRADLVGVGVGVARRGQEHGRSRCWR